MPDELDLLEGLDFAIPMAPELHWDEQSTQFFGPYQLIAQIGEGGVARVIRARHIHPLYAHQTFAIKVLHKSLSADPQVVGLFRREAYVLSLLKHPNVVQTFEAGAQDGQLFIAMEYVHGRDLDDLLIRCQSSKLHIPMILLLHVIGQVLEAMCYAHELCDSDDHGLHLVHRDINPANVFLSYDGSVKLGDFGVASITAGRVEKSRELAGKVGYFAPEQLQGGMVDHRADIFAMGVMMFETLCGARLFEAGNAEASMRLNKRARVPRPSKLNPAITPALEKVMLRALEKRPQDRFATGRAMLAALHPLLPKTAGMKLAVASFMRHLFLAEHLEEVKLQEGLAGRPDAPDGGTQVALYSKDTRAQVALGQLLVSRGCTMSVQQDMTQVDALLTHDPPHVLLVDVHQPNFTAAQLTHLARASASVVPVVAMCNVLDEVSIGAAHAMGAHDLLFKPFNAERALSAVRNAARRSSMGGKEEIVHRPVQRTRVLLVSQDEALASALAAGLNQCGFIVERAQHTPGALARSQTQSFAAVIYDVPTATPADCAFARVYRSGPGISMVPIVFCVEPSSSAFFRGMAILRTRVVPRNAPLAIVAQAVDELCNDTNAGRAFVRYDAQFPAEIRYGGRVFACQVTNLSRGGAMLRCDHIPPVGTEVGLSLRLPGSTLPVSGIGLVVRVALVKSQDSHDAAHVGVEFKSFAGRGEAILIEFIRALDDSLVAQTVAGGSRRAQPRS